MTPGTKNPHNASRSPGGSSSGSGAAVADMQVPIGLGSQTIGSVVRPASFDGVYGFKPTWNAISTEGQKVTSLTLDTFGFMARCVSDLQKLADVFGLQDDESPQHLALGQSRFAVIKPPIWSEAGPGTIAAMDRAAQILKDSGAYVEEVKLPTDFDDVLAVQRAVLRAEAGVAFFKERDEPANYVGHEVAQLAKGIEGGSRRRRYLQAFDKLAALRPQMDEIADKYTAVLAPSSLDVAPADATWSGDPRFNAIWTVCWPAKFGVSC